MVSLWPFRGKDGTPDAIEKKLSQMGAQIEEHEKRLNGLRGRSRRLKALWTLYTILIWAIYATILVLAVGLKNASIESITGLVATPFVIYVVRQFISTYYDWRTTSHETALESLRSQQRETIEELKKITKYNSTQALLERYGASAGITTGAQPQDKQGNAAQRKGGPQQQQQQHPQHPQNGQQQQQQQQQHPHDPNQPPPPTIEALPRPGSQSGRPMSAQSHMSGMTGITDFSQMPSEGMMMHPPHPHMMGPNVLPPAWEEPPREPQWYDRILDVLLGEDEMAAKSRFALICSNCRQVNGLAPPGTADVANVRFMCGRCGAENGKPDVKEIIGKVVAEDRDEGSDVGTPDDTGARRRSSSSKKGSSKKKSGKAAPRQIVEEPTEEEQEGGGSDESSEEVVVVKKKKKGRK